MFARKIGPVLKNCRQSKQIWVGPRLFPQKDITQETRFSSKPTLTTQLFWELGTIDKRIGNTTYIILSPTATHKRHLNQIRRRRLDDPDRTPQDKEEAIETLYDTFDIEPPQAAIEQCRSGRKRKFTEPLTIKPPNPQKEILTPFLTKQKKLGRWVLWEYILPYLKDIFSDLSSLGGDNFSFLTRHLTDGLQAEHG